MAKSTETMENGNVSTIKAEPEREFTSIRVRDEKGNAYTLEFNRRISEAMEREGFHFDMENAPQTSIRTLFRGAFRMHHKGMLADRIDAIWDSQRGKDKLIAMLYRLYLKPLEDLMAEPDEQGDENPTWETV